MHPPDFHKSPEARERCWGCSHPEMFKSTVDDEAFAAKLIADGFYQTSNKYRRVARVIAPRRFEDVVSFSDAAPEWLRGLMREWYSRGLDGGFIAQPSEAEEHLELTTGQFFAFKRLLREGRRAWFQVEANR